MRVLFVVPYPPNLIRVRSLQFARGLARRGHELIVAAVCADAGDERSLDLLKTDGIEVIPFRIPPVRSMANCLWALPSVAPLQSAYSYHPRFSELLFGTLMNRQTDVVHVEHLRGGRYALDLKRMCRDAARNERDPVPVVWDSVDCISHLFRQAAHKSRHLRGRLLCAFELRRTQQFERLLVSQCDRTIVTSPKDAEVLAEISKPYGDAPGSDIRVVCNGVDLDYFSGWCGERETSSVVFSGKMSYHANLTAAMSLVDEIMPIVWQKKPEVRLILAGKDPSPRLRALAGRPELRGRVTVTGTLPDLRPVLGGASVAVAPMPYGAGVQNKVLEAMACGTPVVASDQAVSALKVQPGRDLLVASSAGDHAAAILRLLNDSGLRRRLADAGRSFVRTHHDWSASVRQLEEVYSSCSRSKRIAACGA
jgi:glycosyltransferase involved in cell wall biosynthesis